MSGLITLTALGETETHIASGDSNYVTICGMDGDDPDMAVQQRIEERTGVIVDCQQCISIWETARGIKPSQINNT